MGSFLVDFCKILIETPQNPVATMDDRSVAVGVEKKGGGRKKEGGDFVLHRFIITGSYYELVMIASLWLEPPVMTVCIIRAGSIGLRPPTLKMAVMGCLESVFL
jgi:hypothetical protein